MMADYVSKHTGAVIDLCIDRVLNGEAGTIPNFGTENAGKLLYVNNNGDVTILAIGEGLKIVNGVLSVTGGSAGGSEAVEMSVDASGNATISGVALSVNAEGAATMTGATLKVETNGDAMIE